MKPTQLTVFTKASASDANKLPVISLYGIEEFIQSNSSRELFLLLKSDWCSRASSPGGLDFRFHFGLGQWSVCLLAQFISGLKELGYATALEFFTKHPLDGGGFQQTHAFNFTGKSLIHVQL